MSRRRRTPEQARTEILDAAERLLLREGPDALKVARVAAEVGMSHPGLLHHVGSAEGLAEALHRRASAGIREDLLGLLTATDDASARRGALEAAAARLADPTKGRLLAWVLARGGSPFPPEEELGLARVADQLAFGDVEEARFRVQLVVLAMLGDSLLGAQVRSRLGIPGQDASRFRSWMFELLGRAQSEPRKPAQSSESSP